MIAPTVVLIVGLAAGFALAVSGTSRLRAQSDDAAALRCRLLSLTLAERLRRTSEEDRAIVLERAARRSGAELLLVSAGGNVVVDATQGAPPKARLLGADGGWRGRDHDRARALALLLGRVPGPERVHERALVRGRAGHAVRHAARSWFGSRC